MNTRTYRDTLAALVSEIEALCASPLDCQETARAPSLGMGEGLRARSVQALNSDLRNWVSWWKQSGHTGSIALRKSVELWVQDMEAKGLSANHICRLMNSIKKMLAAMGWPDPEAEPLIVGIMHAKVVEGSSQRASVSPRTKAFGWTSIQRCLEVAEDSPRDTRNVAILMVVYDTMARIDDILGHRGGGEWHVSPVQLEDYQVMRDGSGVLRIGEPTRETYLSPLTVALLNRWLAFRREGAGALFLSDAGTPCYPRAWRPSMRRLLVRAGFSPNDLSPNAVRLGMGKDLLQGGASVEDVRRTGGWTRPDPVLRLAGAHSRPDPTRHLAADQGRDNTTSLHAPTARWRGPHAQARPHLPPPRPSTGDFFGTEAASRDAHASARPVEIKSGSR